MRDFAHEGPPAARPIRAANDEGPPKEEVYYDLEFDRDLIEASFAMQYGIRLSREDIGCGEFYRLLRGLMGDTPLAGVVAVRSERDFARIKGFGSYERKVRADWMRFKSRAATCDKRNGWEADVRGLQTVLERAFS